MDEQLKESQRDFIGYGRHFPQISWPENAQIAINFVINYEEGSEHNILDGDEQSENYLTDWPPLPSLVNERHFSSESLFEYGSRAGIWRLLRLFDEYKVPLTFFSTGLALERNPPFAEYLKQSSHEVAGHGYRWINYRNMREDIERLEIRKTLETLKTLTHKKINGWYTGRVSPNTRRLIVETGLLYDSESYADDLPYWTKVDGKIHLIIPYQLDTNDARYTTAPGWTSGDDFYHYLKNSFDQLYQEGKEFPKMLSIGLHPRISGRPGRTEVLKKFLEYISTYKNVWVCKREEIAYHWHQHYN